MHVKMDVGLERTHNARLQLILLPLRVLCHYLGCVLDAPSNVS